MDNIIVLFLAQAQKNPDAIAIIEKNKSVSFATLLDEVKETAAYFHKKGKKQMTGFWFLFLFRLICIEVY